MKRAVYFRHDTYTGKWCAIIPSPRFDVGWGGQTFSLVFGLTFLCWAFVLRFDIEPVTEEKEE